MTIRPAAIARAARYAAGVLCLTAAPAVAADAAGEDAASDPTIIVTGDRQGYDTQATSSATKTPADLLDIPLATAASRLRRAREEFRRLLKRRMAQRPLAGGIR